MKNLKKKKGFTIVELVIVIAVIGVLSAILIPTFSGLIAKANKSAKQLSLRNSYAAYAAAAMDAAKDESVVYLAEKASLAANDKVYHLNATTGEWVESTVASETYDHVTYVPEGEEVAVDAQFNGYYVYVLHVGA